MSDAILRDGEYETVALATVQLGRGETPAADTTAALVAIINRIMDHNPVMAERYRIRARLVNCRDCGEPHEFGAEADHPDRAPWRARDAGALGFLDELLGDGELP